MYVHVRVHVLHESKIDFVIPAVLRTSVYLVHELNHARSAKELDKINMKLVDMLN